MIDDFLDYVKDYANNLEREGGDSDVIFDFINSLSEHLGYEGKLQPIRSQLGQDLTDMDDYLDLEGEMLEEYIAQLESQVHQKDRIINVLLSQLEGDK